MVGEMRLDLDRAVFSVVVADASTPHTASSLFDINVPDNSEAIYPRISVINGAAPVAVTYNIALVAVSDIEQIGTEITIGQGMNQSAASLPVHITALGTVIPTTTLPVSGTVTVGSFTAGDTVLGRTKITDGTNVAAVKAASTAPVLADPAVVVSLSPNCVNGVTNAANSSTANLGVGAVFTGTSVDISGFAQISVSIFASHASATDGVSYQFSQDGTNWDVVSTATTVAGVEMSMLLGTRLQFFRLVYTNGGTLTTSLRIQTRLWPNASVATLKEVRGTPGLNDLAQTVRSILSGRTTPAASTFSDATIKAASTAVAATDLPLAVGLHPTSPLPAGSNTIGSITTVSTVTNLSQMGGVAINLNSGVRATGTQRVTIATDDIVQMKILPDATTTYAPTSATTTVYATSLVGKASAGVLYRITGYNSLASAQFIQVHAAASLPANGAVPILIFSVPASSNFSFDMGFYGRYFATGILVCNSTTGPTLTVGAANCWFDVLVK
jgi:hypothetical protein